MSRNALRYISAFAVGALIALIVMSVQGIFEESRTAEILRILCDSTFISGVCLACVGLILVASNGGMFDMLGYGAIMFFNVFRRNLKDRKYKDFYEYKKSKEGRKRSTAYLLITGLCYIAVSIIFLIAYNSVYVPM